MDHALTGCGSLRSHCIGTGDFGESPEVNE